MKRLFLSFLFLMVLPPVFSDGLFSLRGIDFQSSVSSVFSVHKDASDSKIKADSGIRLRLSNLTGIFSFRLPYSRFSDFPPPVEFSDFRFGLRASILPDDFPIGLKLLSGTLGFGGAVSRLKSPVPSFYGALRAFSLPASGIRPSIPGFSSSAAPFSVALVLEPSTENCFVPALEFGATMENDFFASVSKKVPFPFAKSASVSLNACSSVYGSAERSSWFSAERPFLPGRFLSADAELSLVFPSAEVFLCFALSQSPFGFFYPWFRSDLSFSASCFTVNSSFYAGDPLLISASGKRIPVWMQVQMNPQFSFYAKDVKISNGLFFQIGLESFRSPGHLPGSLEVRWDGRMKYGLGNVSADAFFDCSFPGGKWSCGAGASASFPFTGFDAEASVSWNTGGGKSSLSLDASFSPGCPLIECAAVSFSSKFGDSGFLSGSSGFSVSLKKKWKFFSMTAKISLSVVF